MIESVASLTAFQLPTGYLRGKDNLTFFGHLARNGPFFRSLLPYVLLKTFMFGGFDCAAGSNCIRGQLHRRHGQVPHGPALHAAPRQGPRPCSPTKELVRGGTRTRIFFTLRGDGKKRPSINLKTQHRSHHHHWERFAGAISSSPIKLLVQ